MNQMAGKTNEPDLPFSDQDFASLAELAHREFGLSLAQSKKPLVYSRLSRRLKARGINSFPAYLDLLGLAGESLERLELISALTTNVTSFFRESHHFETLRTECLLKRMEEIKAGRRFRVWSAGCSSGQEPYSIAMTILDTLPDASRRDVKVLATDIDPQIVAKAKRGRYSADEFQSIPDNFKSRWIDESKDNGSEFSISGELKTIISFAELNLISDWPFKGPFDAIFCRNVAIYFDQATQQRLWRRFTDFLAPGGFLFIGHSERVTGEAANALEGVGITSYQTPSDLGATQH